MWILMCCFLIIKFTVLQKDNILQQPKKVRNQIVAFRNGRTSVSSCRTYLGCSRYIFGRLLDVDLKTAQMTMLAAAKHKEHRWLNVW
jgi:hypothetical protein